MEAPSQCPVSHPPERALPPRFRAHHPPVSVLIEAGPEEVLASLKDLAARPATLRHAVKSLCVAVIPLYGRPVAFDIKNDFLLSYPALRALDLQGFDSLLCADSSESMLTPGVIPFPLRSLHLNPVRPVSYSCGVLLDPLQHTPDLDVLEVNNVVFHPHSADDENIPPIHFSLSEYLYIYYEEFMEVPCTSRGWAAPFRQRGRRRAVPMSLFLGFSSTRNLDEILQADVDLCPVHRISLLIAQPVPEITFLDYGAVLASCSNLRHLHFCAHQHVFLTDSLHPLIPLLVGPLRSVMPIIILRDTTVPTLDAIDRAFAELLEKAHWQLRSLHYFILSFIDSRDAQLSPSNFPLLAKFCHARRIQFVCDTK